MTGRRVPLRAAVVALGVGLAAVVPGTPVFAAGLEPETRCGWFENPTPSNMWLTDRDGEWTLALQGGHQADMDVWPDFAPGQWVVTNGVSYGYGCACFKLIADPKTRLVSKVLSAVAKPLSACRSDKAITYKPG